jgi:hypothetical protein
VSGTAETAFWSTLPSTPRTPWDVIKDSPDHTTLKALIEANELVGVFNRSFTTAFAPVDSVSFVTCCCSNQQAMACALSTANPGGSTAAAASGHNLHCDDFALRTLRYIFTLLGLLHMPFGNLLVMALGLVRA